MPSTGDAQPGKANQDNQSKNVASDSAITKPTGGPQLPAGCADMVKLYRKDLDLKVTYYLREDGDHLRWQSVCPPHEA